MSVKQSTRPTVNPVIKQPEVSQTVLEQRIATLEERLEVLETRLVALERQAHTDHTIGKEALDSIAAYAVNRVNEQLRQALGLSSSPDV